MRPRPAVANLLNGYVQGKLNAEGVLQSLFPETGVILRPGFVYGTRMVGGTALPLGVIGQPLEKVGRASQISAWPDDADGLSEGTGCRKRTGRCQRLQLPA